MQVDADIKSKVDLSGVVQQTLFEAHQAAAEVAPLPAGRQMAWLRGALAHNLADEIRKLRTDKRDVHRERALQAAFDDSSAHLEAWLAADQSSPSQRASREEELSRLCSALAELGEEQRQAVALKHLEGWSVAAIAAEMGRSETAVGGLLRRGMTRLRELLDSDT